MTKSLTEVVFYGRGGQGGVVATQLLAEAFYREGRWAEAFPSYGPQRRGSPVKAFLRVSTGPSRIRSQIYEPDYIVVLDQALLSAEVAKSLKDGGVLIVNTTKKPSELFPRRKFGVATVDATGISLELGLLVSGLPVVNTPMLGAFAKVTNRVKLETLEAVIRRKWAGKIGERNARAAKMAYEHLAYWGKVAYDGARARSKDLGGRPISFPRTGSSGKTGVWRTSRPVIDYKKCNKCLLCWLFCPEVCIEVGKRDKPKIDYEYCKGCGICANECRIEAIAMIREGA